MDGFVDTNLLVYAYAPHQGEKGNVALRWLFNVGMSRLSISTQVLVELGNVLRRHHVRAAEIEMVYAAIEPMRVLTHSPAMIRSANLLCAQHQIQWFDALLLQAALDARCNTLYSEDFSPGRQFKGKHGVLTVVNPFA